MGVGIHFQKHHQLTVSLAVSQQLNHYKKTLTIWCRGLCLGSFSYYVGIFTHASLNIWMRCDDRQPSSDIPMFTGKLRSGVDCWLLFYHEIYSYWLFQKLLVTQRYAVCLIKLLFSRTYSGCWLEKCVFVPTHILDHADSVHNLCLWHKVDKLS